MDTANINSGKITGSSLDLGVFLTINDKGSFAENKARVSHFSLTCSGMLEVASTPQIASCARVLKRLEKSLCAINVKAINNQWKFWNIIDSVTTGLNEWSNSRGSQCWGNCMSLLVDINLSVPSSPNLERGEHATFTALVTEGTLTWSVSTRSCNSWNTSYSATSTPWNSGVFMSLLPVNSMSLYSVLSHVCMNKLDDIISDGCSKNSRHWDLANNVCWIVGVYAYNWTSSHFSLYDIK